MIKTFRSRTFDGWALLFIIFHRINCRRYSQKQDYMNENNLCINSPPLDCILSIRFPVTINWMSFDTSSLNICGVDAALSSVQAYLSLLHAVKYFTLLCQQQFVLWDLLETLRQQQVITELHTCAKVRELLSHLHRWEHRNRRRAAGSAEGGQVFLLVLIFKTRVGR